MAIFFEDKFFDRLTNQSDWSAEWIGSDEIFDPETEPDCNISDPWLRKTVVLDRTPEKAVMFAASVGYHELYVNGVRIGEDVLAPAVTDHSRRARYVAYDISSHLRKGENVIGIWLGASWSIYAAYKTDDKPQTPLVMAQADIYFRGDAMASRRIVTDGTWKTLPRTVSLPSSMRNSWRPGARMNFAHSRPKCSVIPS